MKDDTDVPEQSDRRNSRTNVSRRSILSLVGAGGLAGMAGVGSASVSPLVGDGTVAAHPPAGVTDDPDESNEDDGRHVHSAPDPSAPLVQHDAVTAAIVSEGPVAKVTKNLAVAGRGERALPEGTTDVWAYGGYAYIGTFNVPCGTGEGFGSGELVFDAEDSIGGPGIAVFDVHNRNKPEYVGNIPSVGGSRTNDVKVAEMNSGVVLVHSNEGCSGGPGGFELYNVDDPLAPVNLASVRTDDINAFLRDNFGFTDFGVHNLWLFTQGERDYVAAVVESLFGNFQIFDITDPTSPVFVSGWGAESLFDPAIDWATISGTDFATILDGQDYLFDGVGDSQNRFLHDVTVSDDGTRAYLANWDAGLVLLDISDPANPEFVSRAIDPSAGDGEVNSHQAWPTADGSVVVETEEDFDAFELDFEITSGPNAGDYDAVEGTFTFPIFFEFSDHVLSGPTKYVGFACDGDTVPPAPGPGYIAVVQRGGCRFDEKATNVSNAGGEHDYAGMVVFNDAARGDALVSMTGEFRDLPGLFVGHSTGLAIFEAANASDLAVGDEGALLEVESVPGRWSGIRIWDYADEANPVLASEFDTVCSANPGDESCDPRGTYSVHNVVVEGDKVYVSWYSDGVLVLDISDPYDPVEVARYSETGPDFQAQNGGIQNVWGIYKEPGSPWIYASDRNGGLYVLKELGSGSGKQGRDGRDRGRS